MVGSATSRRAHQLALVVLSLLLVAVRLYGINHSPFEYGEFWRQPDTESIAINFIHYRFNILQPNFHYDGPLPNIPALELQVTTALIAVLYTLFGQHYFLARLVPILFFLGSCAYLYRIGQRYMGDWGAFWAVAIYGLLPVNLFFSRSIQPESAAMFFYVGALYYFQRYADDKGSADRFLALGGLFLALAISQKPQTAILGLPILGLAYQKHGWRFLLQWRLWLCAAAALGLPLLYYVYMNGAAEFHFTEGIATKHVLPNLFSAFRTPAAQEFFKTEIPRALTVPALWLLGLSMLDLRKRFSVVYLWLIAVIIYLLTVGAIIKFYYYLIYITPPLALIMGAFLARFKGWFRVLPALLVAFIGVSSFQVILPLYVEQEEIITQGRLVQQVTQPDDLIVVSTFNPALINASERRGWRYQIHYYPQIPTDPEAELQYYIDHGAKYFVTLKGFIYNDPNGQIKQYLESHFRRIEPMPGYVMYALDSR